MRKNLFYALLMLGASGISLVKPLILAALMAVDDFSHYSTFMGIAGFLVYIVSCGSVEKTVKVMPRLVVLGESDKIDLSILSTSKTLCVRGFLLSFLACLVWFFFDSTTARMIGGASILSIILAELGLFASVQRAFLKTLSIGWAFLGRAVIVTLFVVFLTYYFGLTGALFGEMLGGGAAVVLYFFIVSSYDKTKKNVSNVQEKKDQDASGVKLLIVYLILSIPFYLDRLFIVKLYGETVASGYLFLTILSLVSSIIVNIVCQKMGPQLIAKRHEGVSFKGVFNIAILSAAVCILIWLVAFFVIISIFQMNFFSPYFGRYIDTVNPLMFLGFAFFGCFQVYSLFEFVLLAEDEENSLLRSSLLFLLLGIVGAILFWIVHPPIYWFIFLLTGLRLSYGLLLFTKLVQLRNG